MGHVDLWRQLLLVFGAIAFLVERHTARRHGLGRGGQVAILAMVGVGFLALY